MNTSIIERNILDKNIYHDITGREIKHGDFITSTFNNVFLGIAEYVNFIQDSKFESGIAFHVYKKIPKARKQFFELVHEKDTLELTNTTISCY